MKNIYNIHMIIRMIQIGSLEDQKIIMILMILDLRIFSDDLGRSLKQWSQKILDQKIIISKRTWSWFMFSSDLPKWSMVDLDQKFLKLISFTDINFQRSWSIGKIYKLSKIILFEPLICYRWSSAMTREPIWWKKVLRKEKV
jgi:hypothetical protein